jgi:hypothetical protein
MASSSEKVAQTVQFALFLERGELRKRRKLDGLRCSRRRFSSFQGVAQRHERLLRISVFSRELKTDIPRFRASLAS